MSALVTGGAGFIGSHLVRALVAAGEPVTVLDNMRRGNPARLPREVRLMNGDIRDIATVAAAIEGCDVVYHLAAQSNVLGAVSDLDYSFTTNVVGTYTLLAAARAGGVGRVVFTSSREVYGEPASLPVDEEAPLLPKNAYGASKLAGELYCRVFSQNHGLEVSVLRLANVYGPGDSDRVIPLWLERARTGEDLLLYGGEQMLDLVPVALVIEALRRAARTPLGDRPVNVGSGQGTTLRALARRIQALPGVRSSLTLLPARQIEVTRFVAKVARMGELLGLAAPIDPLEGLLVLWEG